MFKKILGTVFVFVIDVITVFILLQCAILLRINILPYFLKFPEFPVKGLTDFWWVFPAWLSFFAYEGLYTKRFSFWDEVRVLWKVIFFSTVAVFSILYLGKIGEQVSRSVIIIMGVIAFPLLPFIRINTKKLFIYMGLLKSKVLILGAGNTGKLIFNALKRDRNTGFDIVGFLDDDPEKIGKKIEGLKIRRGVHKAEKYIVRCRINDIIIAMPSCEKTKLISIINKLQHKAQNILFIPDLFGIAALGTNLQHFFQEQTIGLEVKNNLARPINSLIKKIFDLLISIPLLIILSVPMAILFLLIKGNSKDPAIFSQERVGKNGKTFRCYKFRTMYKDADKNLNELLDNNYETRNEWEYKWKIRDDPRITKIGSFLRKTSLDELPQIFNVLKGEMSLIGPRPVTKKEIDVYYKDNAELCFAMPPGITGLWQVSGRSNTSYDYRIALDLWYVKNWDLWLDVVILLKTVKTVISGEGAR